MTRGANDIIRLARIAKGFSTHKLGALVGVSAMFVSRLERGGHVKITSELAKKIANVLEISPKVLFQETGAE